MTPTRRQTGLVTAILLGLAIIFIFESNTLRTWRNGIVAKYLSNIVGQSVLVEGNVNVDLFPKFSLKTTGVRIPSEAVPEIDLLTLESAKLYLSPWAGVEGWTQVPAIEARGLRLNLLRMEDETISWQTFKPRSTSQPRTPSAAASADSALIRFISTRQVDFSDMQVTMENRTSGFVFNFALDDFRVVQTPASVGRSVDLVFGGTMNGQRVTVDGHFPRGTPFSVTSRIGATDLALTGTHDPSLGPLGFDSLLTLNASELDTVLRALALKGSAQGSGRVEARLMRREGAYDLEEIETLLTLDGGRTVKMSGTFTDLRHTSNFDLNFSVDLIGDGLRPPPAIFLRDIRPEAVSLQLTGRNKLVTIEDFSFVTNAFEEELRDVGPFRVGEIQRAPDGRLELRDVSIVLGPPDRPFLSANGQINDLLALRGYKLEAALDLPATQFLRTLRPERIAEFGRLIGHLHIGDEDGRTVLHDFEIESDGSDLWGGRVTARSDDLRTFKNAELTVALSTPDSAHLLEAIQLDPVDIGTAGFSVALLRDEKAGIDTRGQIAAGETRIDLTSTLRLAAGAPVLRAALTSDMVRLDDLRNVVLAAREIAREPVVHLEMRALQLQDRIDPVSATAGDDDGFQPLVLPAADTETDTAQDEDNLSEFQPLVLPDPLRQKEDLSDFEPLVLSPETGGAGDVSIGALKDPALFLRSLDAEVAIAFARIAGQRGISHLDSSLTVKEGQARLGPLRLEYGGGYASLFAQIDAINRPDRLRVSGKTGGWDVGKLASSLGGKVHAEGTLTGQIDVSARYANRDSFARSLSGTAQVEMGAGRVSTTLIDLAGLGVLPWLFSVDRRAGYSPITCLRAPLRFNEGKVVIDNAVLETARVQLVATGQVDYLRDTISLRAEPRPVGRPLARSAWPFEVSGALSEPKISLAKRNTRRATQPLAMPDQRIPCVADVIQVRPDHNNRPR